MSNPTDAELAQALGRKIEDRTAIVGVVGLGYVGLPLATSFADAGFRVIGMELDPVRSHVLQEGRSFIRDVPDEVISRAVAEGRLKVTSSYGDLAEADAVLICVPTPVKEGSPDLSHVVSAGEALASVLKKGALVVLESTTYPGTTEDILNPILETGAGRVGSDFLLAFSPERIDPGSATHDLASIPKVVGGSTPGASEAAAALYRQVINKVFPVSGTREAELAKLIENTFRHVNIALINELAVYAHEMGIDIWEAIEAAATKPFGFMPFWPGPGWGGHCIPLDPTYLSWRIRQNRAHEVRFVELAHTVNSEMPRYVVERVGILLNDHGKAIRDSKILMVGMAYKGGTEDTRGAPGLVLAETLLKRGATLTYHDPLVKSVDVGGGTIESQPLSDGLLHDQDLVVIVVPQVNVDYERIAEHASLILDCCNALRRTSETIQRL